MSVHLHTQHNVGAYPTQRRRIHNTTSALRLPAGRWEQSCFPTTRWKPQSVMRGPPEPPLPLAGVMRGPPGLEESDRFHHPGPVALKTSPGFQPGGSQDHLHALAIAKEKDETERAERAEGERTLRTLVQGCRWEFFFVVFRLVGRFFSRMIWCWLCGTHRHN